MNCHLSIISMGGSERALCVSLTPALGSISPKFDIECKYAPRNCEMGCTANLAREKSSGGAGGLSMVSAQGYYHDELQPIGHPGSCANPRMKKAKTSLMLLLALQ